MRHEHHEDAPSRLIVQDLSQLYAAYGHHESIVLNCHVRVAYTPNKIETAQLLSHMAGVMTVHKGRRMYSGNRFLPFLPHVMASDEETQRPLLTADEAMCLPEDSALVFCSGHRPIHAAKLRYHEHPELLRRARLAPPAESDRIVQEAEPSPHPSPGDHYGAVPSSEGREVDPA